jgi:hypothetical protein
MRAAATASPPSSTCGESARRRRRPDLSVRARARNALDRSRTAALRDASGASSCARSMVARIEIVSYCVWSTTNRDAAPDGSPAPGSACWDPSRRPGRACRPGPAGWRDPAGRRTRRR